MYIYVIICIYIYYCILCIKIALVLSNTITIGMTECYHY